MAKSDGCDYLGLEKPELLRLVSNAFHAKPADIAVEKMGDAQGFLSLLAALRITWTSSPNHIVNGSSGGDHKPALPDTVIYKQPTTDKVVEMMTTSFNNKLPAGESDPTEDSSEAAAAQFKDYFFTLLKLGNDNESSVLKLFQEMPSEERPIPVPRLYARELTSEESFGYIMMEDLREGTTLPSFAKGMSVPCLTNCFQHLAELHAYCFTSTEWKDVLKPIPFFEIAEPAIAANMEIMRVEFGDIFPFTDDHITQITDIDTARDLFQFNPERDFAPVLAHGDIWTNNLLVDEKSPSKIVSVIDWQLAHVGSPVEDMTMLLYMSASPEVRHKHTNTLLEHYHSHLSKAMRASSPKALPPYNLVQLKNLMDQYVPYGTFVTMMQLPMLIGSTKSTGEDARMLARRQVAIVEDALEYVNRK